MENCKIYLEHEWLSGPVPYLVVECVWDDAEAQTGWEAVKTPKEALVLTLGFLVGESDDHVVIASSICPGENDTNCRLQIPKGMIKHFRII